MKAPKPRAEAKSSALSRSQAKFGRRMCNRTLPPLRSGSVTRSKTANAAASTHPAMMPNVRSSISVRPKVASNTPAPRQSCSRRRNSSFSAMFQHTTTSTPASADSGMKLASGAATTMNTSTKTAHAHAGYRADCAGADIGGGARNRAGDADAAEQCGGDVGDALRHDLHVVAVLAPCHAVGDLGRQQAFDRAQQGEGERRRQHRENGCVRDRRQLRRRHTIRQLAEMAADGFDRQVRTAMPPARQASPRSACPARSARAAAAGRSGRP